MIVVDGCNRGRLWQADAPVMDRLAREGTEYLCVEPAYPARTVVCFSSMLTGATPAEHGMRSNFAPRLGVRRESVFDVLERDGRRGRLVGIAHLLDPFGEDVVRSVTSVQPTSEIDRSLTAEARRVVDDEDPDLLVLQLLAADQLGHVRGVRSGEYLDQLAETDRHVGAFLDFLGRRGKLDDATVILMADHGQGRGIGGHGHLDWGERPVPFVVWGRGAAPGAVSREPRSVLELAVTVSRLLGVPAPEAARGRPLLPADGGGEVEPRRRPAILVWGRSAPLGRIVGEDGAWRSLWRATRRLPSVPSLAASRRGVRASGRRAARRRRLARPHARDRPGARRAGASRIRSRAGSAPRFAPGSSIARDEGYAAAVYLDGDGEYDPADFARVLDPVARGRADYVLGSRFLGGREGMTLAPRAREPRDQRALGFLMQTVTSDGQTGYRAFSARALALARIAHDYNYAQVLTLSLWGNGIEPVEVPVRYRRRTSGRSFVRYPEYLARVAPAVWREWRAARASRRTTAATATPTAPASQNGHPPPRVNNGSTPVSGPNGASGRSAASEPPPQRTSA